MWVLKVSAHCVAGLVSFKVGEGSSLLRNVGTGRGRACHWAAPWPGAEGGGSPEGLMVTPILVEQKKANTVSCVLGNTAGMCEQRLLWALQRSLPQEVGLSELRTQPGRKTLFLHEKLNRKVRGKKMLNSLERFVLCFWC